MFPVRQVEITPEKANEYMQVAGLLTGDVELLHQMSQNQNLSREDLVGQIELLHENMVEMTTNKESRESRWGASVAIWGLMGLSPDTGVKHEPVRDDYRFNISGDPETVGGGI